jgi:hypothetical protein
MDDQTRRVSELLREVAHVHHVVYRITDGADDDWATFYGHWLTRLSELPQVLGREPIRSHLVHVLVQCERAYAEASPGEPWEDWYAARIVERFG